MTAMRWTIRLLGMVNVIILARLLAPEDFGLIAMSSIIINLVTTVTDGSVDHAIARAKDPKKSDYDSAWTLQIGVGAANAFLIIAISPFFVWLFDDSRLQVLFFIGAFAPLIIGFENIGTVNFRRALDFKKEYRYWVARKLIKIVITIGMALLLRNYLALALAAPISAAFTVILSYRMSNYRPTFDLSRISHIWDFSKWLIVLDTSRLFERRGDEFAAGIYGIADQVGHYSVASDLATMPTREMIEPLDRVILPALAPHSNIEATLRPILASSLGLIIAVSCATGFGMYLIADPFVRLFLGSQWIESIAFFEMIALSAVAGGIALGFRPIFLVLGEERRLAIIYFISLVIFLPIFIYLAGAHSFLAMAQARIALAIWLVIGSLVYPLRTRLINWQGLLGALWRPLLASASMIICVRLIQSTHLDGLLWILLRDVVVGALTFTMTMLLSWRLFSRQEGLEAQAYKFIQKKVKATFFSRR
jgi:polysaccharide transporter, PST family